MASPRADVLRYSAGELAGSAYHFIGCASRELVRSGCGAEEIVLDAPDLATAQRERRRLLSGSVSSPTSVLLRVEALVAESADRAFAMWEDSQIAKSSEVTTVRYVGTPIGLAGLISDVVVADVADGVVVVALPPFESSELIVQQTIPWLNAHHVVRPSEARLRGTNLLQLPDREARSAAREPSPGGEIP